VILIIIGIDVYAYAWTTLDTRAAYAQLFHNLFRVLGEVARQPVSFAHIHRFGIQSISVDMCSKQAGGMLLLYSACAQYIDKL
jgi:hypothetical protein